MPSPSVAPVEVQRKEQVAELMQLRQEIFALKGELAALKAERQSLRDEASALKTRVTELEASARAGQDRERELAEMHRTVSGLRSRLVELEEETVRLGELELEVQALQGSLQERDARIAELKSRPAPPPQSVGDDLKTIRGIGPKYEKALKGLGIVSLRQIAEWTPTDVALYAEKLKLKRERIERDDWVGRARKLLEL